MTGSRPLRILDFDLENRPLSYRGGDAPPTDEITSIAWCWVGEPNTLDVVLLGVEPKQEMLEVFLHQYALADMVTGHYITRHDLPKINGECMEHGFPMLEPKLAQDTRTQLKKKSELPATQEALYEMLTGKNAKFHMTQAMWREANRLTPEGIALTRERATADVVQHMEMRELLIERQMLRPPRVWRP